MLLQIELANLYGIQIIEVTNDDIHNNPELKTLVDVDKAHGFIYKGNIYINKSNNSPDTKLHEMLHLIFGSVKYQNRLLYDNLMQLAFSQDKNMARGFNQFVEQQKNLEIIELWVIQLKNLWLHSQLDILQILLVVLG